MSATRTARLLLARQPTPLARRPPRATSTLPVLSTRAYATHHEPQSPPRHPNPQQPHPPRAEQQPDRTAGTEGAGRAEPTAGQRHRSFYAEILPAWLPIIVIGTAVFLTLQMTRAALAQERFKSEIQAELAHLEKTYDAERERARALTSHSASAVSASASAPSSSGARGTGSGEVLAATLPTLVKPPTLGDVSGAAAAGGRAGARSAVQEEEKGTAGKAEEKKEQKEDGKGKKEGSGSWWGWLVGRS